MGWRSERGAVAVEFTIMLVFVIIPVLFGMTAFGMLFSRLEGYESAVREGARYASVSCQPRDPGYPTTGPCTPAMIVGRIDQASTNPALTSPIMVAIGPDPAGQYYSDMDCSNHRGLPIAVSWVQSFDLTTYPFNIGLGTRVRTITGVFRCE